MTKDLFIDLNYRSGPSPSSRLHVRPNNELSSLMTNQHPITPPPEQVQQWRNAAPALGVIRDAWISTEAARWGADQQLKLDAEQIAQAYQKGANQELEACCAEVAWLESSETAKRMRERRRPKPPSLKEQALALVSHDFSNQPCLSEKGFAIIRRALEALPND